MVKENFTITMFSMSIVIFVAFNIKVCYNSSRGRVDKTESVYIIVK